MGGSFDRARAGITDAIGYLRGRAIGSPPNMIYRVRKQLVEEGFEAVLSRKRRIALRQMSCQLNAPSVVCRRRCAASLALVRGSDWQAERKARLV